MKKLALLLVFFVLFFFRVAETHAASYYFSNAVNTDPTEQGNYWDDEELEIGASSLPDFNVDSVTVTEGATFDGNIIFNGESYNYGTVTGDAIFMEGQSGNEGTVNGTLTRRYTQDVVVNNDLVTNGPWTVIADGAEVNISSGTFDNTTIFSEINGGSFIYVSMSERINIAGDSIVLTYDRMLDPVSVPDEGDYVVEVNGIPVDIANIDITDYTVMIDLVSAVNPSDIVELSYIPGATPVKELEIGADAPGFESFRIMFAIPTGDGPNLSSAVGTKVYVSNTADNSVSVIDTTTGTIIQTIAVGENPAVSAAVGTKVYVFTGDGNISVIDSITDTVITTISIGSPGTPTVVGDKLYVSRIQTDSVVVIDTTTDAVTVTIPVGDNPAPILTVGTVVYVGNTEGDTISVIDTTTNTVIDTIAVGDFPSILIEVGTKVYVSNTEGDTISVIDTTTNTVIDTIDVGDRPYLFALVGTKLYVYMPTLNNFLVINTISDDVIGTVPSVGELYSMTAAGEYVFLYNSTNGLFSVVDTISDSVVSSIPMGGVTYSIQVGNTIYLSATSSDYVVVIDIESINPLIPNLTSFSTTSPSGTYTVGQSIPITAHFDKILQADSTMTVLLNSGRSVILDQHSGATLSGTYTIQVGDSTPDLAIKSITAADVSDANGRTRTAYDDLPSSVGSFTGENSFITRNLGDSKNIQIGSYASIETGSNPYQISANIGGFLYVANQGSHDVSVIRLSDHTIVDTIEVGDEPYGLANVGTKLYVANILSNNVSVIDTTTNIVTATINVGVKPYYVAVVGTDVYVTNGASNTVSVIDSSTDTVTDTISVGSYPRGIKAHGTDLYVANYGDPNYSGGNYISVIDSATNTVIDTIVTPGGSDGPRGVTTLGDKVYVTNYRSHDVSVIHTDTNEITNTISVGVGPRGIVGLGTTLYVENFDDGTISIIDTNTNTVIDTIDVGHSPSGITTIGTDLYISSFQDDTLMAINTATNTLRTTFVNIVEEEEEEEEQSSGGGSSGSIARPSTMIPITPLTPPTDCLPSYNFSPSTGQACSSSAINPVNPTTTNTSSTPSPLILTRTLKTGMSGSDVKALQVYLNTKGFTLSTTGAGSTGFETMYFGAKTKAAVIKFQVSKGLMGDGIVGPLTKAQLK